MRASIQVGKEDLMNMVRYGAEMVFSSEPTNLTEAGACMYVCLPVCVCACV